MDSSLDQQTSRSARVPGGDVATLIAAPTLEAALPLQVNWANLARFAAVTAQFAALVWVIAVFRLESRTFAYVAALACAGFPIHHLLAIKARLPFFVVLSLASIALAFGWTGGAWIVGLGACLIGICHLPLAYRTRVILLLGVAALLVAARAGWLNTPAPVAIWPILGSMFMFRLIVYMHDLRHNAAPFSSWRALGYFFMLPNVCFPLFPVVDYKTYCRTYYNSEPYAMYQVGLRWMVRGVIQLILYRLVYQNLMIGPAEVTTAGQLAYFMITTFALYLHVSGLFHVIIGMLHLFGFNLPETHHRFLLSASFTEFWQRINIYWKDFMQKVFFFPAFFRLKRRVGDAWAIAIATAFTFLITWLFHSYQFFWPLGKFPINWPDAVFWSVLGALVLVTALYQARHGRARTLKKVRTVRGTLKRSVCTMGVFLVICTLWSLWNSESLHEWGTLMTAAARVSFADAAWIAGGLLLVGVAAAFWGDTTSVRTEGPGGGPGERNFRFWRTAATVGGLTVLAIAVSVAPLVLPADSDSGRILAQLKENRLNTRDKRLMERGYYETITGATRFSPQLWHQTAEQPPDWKALGETEAVRPTDDIRRYELLAGQSLVFNGARMTTNRWGMRDRDYEQAKPEGALRIALLGASHSMGSGVEDHQTYENLVEDRLNREFGGEGRRFEILNFSVAGYGIFAKMMRLEQQEVFAFEPDWVLLLCNSDELERSRVGLESAWAEKRRVPDYISRGLQEAGLDERSSLGQIRRQLDLIALSYQRFAELCRANRTRPFVMYLPQPIDIYNTGRLHRDGQHLRQLAESAGLTFLDLSGAFAGLEDSTTVRLAPWDEHPNVKGHEHLADQFYKALVPHLKHAEPLVPPSSD